MPDIKDSIIAAHQGQFIAVNSVCERKDPFRPGRVDTAKLACKRRINLIRERLASGLISEAEPFGTPAIWEGSWPERQPAFRTLHWPEVANYNDSAENRPY